MKARQNLYLDPLARERLDRCQQSPAPPSRRSSTTRCTHISTGAAQANSKTSSSRGSTNSPRSLAASSAIVGIVIESLALFRPLPTDRHCAAGRSQPERRAVSGAGRFKPFVDQVGRRLAVSAGMIEDVLDREPGKGARHEYHATRNPERRRAMLQTAMGADIAAALADPAVIEVMVNPDGKLWVDRSGGPHRYRRDASAPSEVERIIRLVASHIAPGGACRQSDRVGAELPETGERFEGLLPPVAPAPCFSIRKPAANIYHACRLCRRPHPARRRKPTLLIEAIRRAQEHPVAGGTSSGKTTLVNALLAEIATHERARRHPGGHARAAMRGARLRGAAHQAGRGHSLPIWCARRCGCGPTASSSARCAAPKRSTC